MILYVYILCSFILIDIYFQFLIVICQFINLS